MLIHNELGCVVGSQWLAILNAVSVQLGHFARVTLGPDARSLDERIGGRMTSTLARSTNLLLLAMVVMLGGRCLLATTDAMFVILVDMKVATMLLLLLLLRCATLRLHVARGGGGVIVYLTNI